MDKNVPGTDLWISSQYIHSNCTVVWLEITCDQKKGSDVVSEPKNGDYK